MASTRMAQSHDRRRTALARSGQPNLDDIVGIDSHDDDISAIGLEVGPDPIVKHLLDSLE